MMDDATLEARPAFLATGGRLLPKWLDLHQELKKAEGHAQAAASRRILAKNAEHRRTARRSLPIRY